MPRAPNKTSGLRKTIRLLLLMVHPVESAGGFKNRRGRNHQYCQSYFLGFHSSCFKGGENGGFECFGLFQFVRSHADIAGCDVDRQVDLLGVGMRRPSGPPSPGRPWPDCAGAGPRVLSASSFWGHPAGAAARPAHARKPVAWPHRGRPWASASSTSFSSWNSITFWITEPF